MNIFKLFDKVFLPYIIICAVLIILGLNVLRVTYKYQPQNKLFIGIAYGLLGMFSVLMAMVVFIGFH